VRESEDGRWTLPGGWADVGDTPSLAAVREVKEESGYDVVPTKLAAVYDRNRHGHPVIPFHAYKLFFICSITGGAAAHSFETDAVDFFDEDQIPPLSTTRVTLAQIEHMFGHYRHSEWPTSFD
jgi:ADP-ribose pyrophosphatase YjhB (NUDIX family)